MLVYYTVMQVVIWLASYLIDILHLICPAYPGVLIDAGGNVILQKYLTYKKKDNVILGKEE